VMAGPDPRVPVHCPTPAADFAALLAEPIADRPLAGIRVAVTTDFGLGVPVERDIAAVVREEAEVLAELGATVEEGCPRLREADRVFDATRAFDMALALRDVVAGFPGQVKDEVVWNVERGLALTSADLMDVAIARGRLDQDIARFFSGFDVLLAPTTQLVPFPAEWSWPREVAGVSMTTYIEWMRSATLISATGCPAISVPGGFTGAGLPVGLQMVGAPGRDVDLLRVARAYDAATRYADRAPAGLRS
jgi:amidase